MTPPVTANADDTTLERPIYANRVRLLYDNMITGQLVTLMVAGGVAAIAYPRAGLFTTATWAAAMCFVAMLRMLSVPFYRKAAAQSASPVHWLQLFQAGVIISGLLWILGAWLFLPRLDLTALAVYVLIMGGMAAGAIAVLGADRLSFLAYTSCLLLPLSVLLGLQDAIEQKILGALGSAYYVALLVAANRFYETLRQSLYLGARNEALMKDLETKAELERTRMRELQLALAANIDEREETAKENRRRETLQQNSEAFRQSACSTMGILLDEQRKTLRRLVETHPESPEAGELQAAQHLFTGVLLNIKGAGRQTVPGKNEPFSPVTLLDVLARAEQTKLAAQRRAIQLNCDPAIPAYLYGNANRCGQIILNLLRCMVVLSPIGEVRLDARVMSRNGTQLVLRILTATRGASVDAELAKIVATCLRRPQDYSAENTAAEIAALAIAQDAALELKSRIEGDLTDVGNPRLWIDLPLDTGLRS